MQQAQQVALRELVVLVQPELVQEALAVQQEWLAELPEQPPELVVLVVLVVLVGLPEQPPELMRRVFSLPHAQALQVQLSQHRQL